MALILRGNPDYETLTDELKQRFWKELIEEQEASGESVSAWCKKVGINPNSFNTRKRMYRNGEFLSAGQLAARACAERAGTQPVGVKTDVGAESIQPVRKRIVMDMREDRLCLKIGADASGYELEFVF